MFVLKFWRSGLIMIFLCLSVWAYRLSVDAFAARPKETKSVEISVYLPPIAQLISAVGDRYLAANIGVFRSFMVGAEEQRPETFEIVAKLQRDAARFNAAHEDNIYTAAALLPDQGHLHEAQEILWRAQQARPQDPLPLFFYAFNQLYFESDPAKAAGTLYRGSERFKDVSTRLSMQAMAARWLSHLEWNEAIAIIEQMGRSTRNPELRDYMAKRRQRLQNYIILDEAAKRWIADKGQAPHASHDLVDAGYLKAIPVDPFGKPYYFDKQGRPTIKKPKSRKPQ